MQRAHLSCSAYLLFLASLAPACKDDAPSDGDADESTGAGTGSDTGDTGGGEPLYNANIRRTSHGIAHITADDWGSLAFGQAYAFTEDKGCLLADQIIKVRSERSRWFGPGDANANIYSDL